MKNNMMTAEEFDESLFKEAPVTEKKNDKRKKVLAVDVDGVVFDIVNKVEKIVEQYNPNATMAYADKLLLEHTLREQAIIETYSKDKEECDRRMIEESNRYTHELRLFHIARDLIFEEIDERCKGIIDYHELYRKENLFPGVIEFLKELIENNKVKKIYFTTQINCLKEQIEKAFTLTLEAPEIQIVFIPFHDTPFINTDNEELYLKNGDRSRANKALWFQELTGEDLTNAVFIDDSKGIYEQAKKARATAFWRDPTSKDPLEVFIKVNNYLNDYYLLGPTDDDLWQQELAEEEEFEKRYQKLLKMYK